MKAFLKWAKAHNITFKRTREERAAFEVWKACNAEHDKALAQLKKETKELSDLLEA